MQRHMPPPRPIEITPAVAGGKGTKRIVKTAEERAGHSAASHCKLENRALLFCIALIALHHRNWRDDMADSNDETLSFLIAQMAVLEQLTINLTHLVSSEYEDALAVRSGLLADIRERLSVPAGGDTRKQAFSTLALKQLDRLEPRILGETGKTGKH
jgi:hypothetical protein